LTGQEESDAKELPCLWVSTTRPKKRRSSIPESLKAPRSSRFSRYGEAGREIDGRLAGSVIEAMMDMKKLDIARLKQAYAG
jgi:hypothetical protein